MRIESNAANGQRYTSRSFSKKTSSSPTRATVSARISTDSSGASALADAAVQETVSAKPPCPMALTIARFDLRGNQGDGTGRHAACQAAIKALSCPCEYVTTVNTGHSRGSTMFERVTMSPRRAIAGQGLIGVISAAVIRERA